MAHQSAQIGGKKVTAVAGITPRQANVQRKKRGRSIAPSVASSQGQGDFPEAPRFLSDLARFRACPTLDQHLTRAIGLP